MPSIKTITYSDNADGWTSFWSYQPDWMIGLSNVFYSWRDGNLWKHNSNQVSRGNFYSTSFASTIKTIFNEDSASTKMFKTLSLDSTATWTATMLTDLDINGSILSSDYVEKEGGWYAYIRANSATSNSPNLLSTQGIGNTHIGSAVGATATFPFVISTNLAVGDRVFFNNTLVGTIVSATATTITVAGAGFPGGAGYVYVVKDSIAESFGLRGYYMEVNLSVLSTSEVELFSISSSLFKSYM
jgi:hypothetical protein